MSFNPAEFSDANFDVKAWVNSACAGCAIVPTPPTSSPRADPKPAQRPILTFPAVPSPISVRCPRGESMEKYLSEVEMKLQLVAEDISLALEEQSVAGLQRIPRAVAEIDRVELESKNLQTRIAGILKRLDEAETGSRASVNLLRDIDAVKGRMELTRDTLAEAAGLAELMRSADDVFAGGNVRSMADIVASMRRSLKVVGSVPEFEDAPERVEALEHRLERAVVPELVKALAAENTFRASELRNVLDAAGRITALIHAYAEVRVVDPLRREWDAFKKGTSLTTTTHTTTTSEAQRFAEWLPGYCEKVATRLRREVSFCRSAFPRECEELIATAWVKLSEATRKEFSERMASQRLDWFIAAHRAAGDGFSAAAKSVAEATGPERAAYALRAALAPFDAVRDRYGELEARALAEDLAKLEVRRCDDVEAAAGEMSAAIPVAIESLGRAMERCVALTAGTQASAMLEAVDDGIVRYVDSLHTAVRRLRKGLGLGLGSQGLPGGDAEGSDGRVAGEESIQSALQLTAVAHALTARVKDLERSLIASLKELRGALLPALPEPGPASEMPQPAAAEALTPALAAVHANPDGARRLRALLDRVHRDVRFAPLARGVPRCADFEDCARDFVLDVLLSKVRAEFRGLARRAEWSTSAESSEFDLPTFSAYPQGYVTTAGEYLLSLPQHLESIADAAEEERAAAAAAGEMGRVGLEEGEPAKSPTAADAEAAAAAEHFDSGEWMTRVVEAAAGLLLAEVRGITTLGEPGAAQLAADLEYFNNIISALFSEPPSALRTYAVCAAAARDSYAISVRDVEGMDEDVIRAVAKARGIKLN